MIEASSVSCGLGEITVTKIRRCRLAWTGNHRQGRHLRAMKLIFIYNQRRLQKIKDEHGKEYLHMKFYASTPKCKVLLKFVSQQLCYYDYEEDKGQKADEKEAAKKTKEREQEQKEKEGKEELKRAHSEREGEEEEEKGVVIIIMIIIMYPSTK